jgi:hypothetical protein
VLSFTDDTLDDSQGEEEDLLLDGIEEAAVPGQLKELS